MKKGNYSHYSGEFREEAVRMVMEEELSLMEAARRLSLPESTLRSWVKLFKEGKLKEVRTPKQPLTEVEEELVRLKRELIQVKKERDILKKAAAYFAKESLHGTQ